MSNILEIALSVFMSTNIIPLQAEGVKFYTEPLTPKELKEEYRKGVIKYRGYHSVITIK